MFDLFLDTIRALIAPRRLVPIAIVCVPLVVAQHTFSLDARADIVAIVMVGLFIGVGPWSYRALFYRSSFRTQLAQIGWFKPGPWLRLGAFAMLGGLPALFGLIVPRLFGLPYSFLTYSVNLAVAATLFWVGSWGLARDIDQEQGLIRERARAEQLEREAHRATLLALQAHLDPHFLFNTLNAIAEWCREDPVHAERAILDLSAVLREVMQGVRLETWSLARELDLARQVWELHAVRDPERYGHDWTVPHQTPQVEVPPMILLPLVENAVKHGPAKGHVGRMALQVQVEQTAVAIHISNPGAYTGPRDGGEGLPMVHKRLELYFDDRASLDMQGVDDRTVATLRLPYGATT